MKKKGDDYLRKRRNEEKIQEKSEKFEEKWAKIEEKGGQELKKEKKLRNNLTKK